MWAKGRGGLTYEVGRVMVCQLEKRMKHINARGCMIREAECDLVP